MLVLPALVVSLTVLLAIDDCYLVRCALLSSETLRNNPKDICEMSVTCRMDKHGKKSREIMPYLFKYLLKLHFLTRVKSGLFIDLPIKMCGQC